MAAFVVIEALLLCTAYALADSSSSSSGGGSGSVTQGTTPWVDQIAAGGGMDFAGSNAIAPGSAFAFGCIYNSSPPTMTNGHASPCLLDANGNLQIASPSVLAAIAAPLTPCTTPTCSGENPIGPVLINGTLPAFAATPTVISTNNSAFVTTPVASPGLVNWTAHGLVANQVVVFTVATGGALPTGITAGVPYYVISAGLTANAFEIATTPGGTAINFTGSSSGTQMATAFQIGPVWQGVVWDFTANTSTYVTGQTAPAGFDKAGQLRIGNGSFTVTPNIGTPNVTNVSHAPGTVVGTRNGATTSAIQFLKTGDAGEVNRLVVNSTSSGVTVGFKAYFFQSAPSTSITEAAALTLSAADIAKIIDVENLSPPDGTIGGTIWTTPIGLRIPIGNSIGVYVIVVVTGSASFTPVANSISMYLEGRY